MLVCRVEKSKKQTNIRSCKLKSIIVEKKEKRLRKHHLNNNATGTI